MVSLQLLSRLHHSSILHKDTRPVKHYPPHGAVETGFTLVEMVVVIVVLGIIAAEAMPHFTDLGREARVAVVKRTAGNLRSGAELVHAKAAVMIPAQLGQYGTVPVQGSSIDTNYGYPNAADVYHKLLIDHSRFTPFSIGSYVTEFRLTAAPNPSTCKIIYAAPTAPSHTASTTISTGGC